MTPFVGRTCDACGEPITSIDVANLDYCEPHDFACDGPGADCSCDFAVHAGCCWAELDGRTCSPEGRLREIVRRLVGQIGDPAAPMTGVFTDLLVAARDLVGGAVLATGPEDRQAPGLIIPGARTEEVSTG